MRQVRVAVIDIGTNTVLLLVAEGSPTGDATALAERATVTRLGEGVDRTGVLSGAAIARTTQCLAGYADTVKELGVEKVTIVATSAMRDASGGEAIAQAVSELFGVDLRILTGHQEALFAFRGALSDVPASTVAAVFDIGGGSTEIAIGETGEPPKLSFVDSIDVGTVRLTERYGDDIGTIRSVTHDAFSHLPPLSPLTVPVGIAGTITTFAAISLALDPYDGARVHGLQMTVTQLESIVARLSELDLDARRRVIGLDPKRADVIVTGGLIALALLRHWSANRFTVSDRGIRWGLAAELLRA